MINRIVFKGLLLSDWKVRQTNSGLAVASARCVIQDTKKENNESVFIELVAFGKTADLLADNTGNKSIIFGDGRLAEATYTKKDGTKGYQFKIYIDKAEFTWKNKTVNNNNAGSEEDVPF